MIPVLDLFAGPGGLGEGFTAFRNERGEQVFRIVLSIEKEPFAHETLKLRSFFRQFSKPTVPEDYYDHLRGTLDREELYRRFPKERDKADSEAWNAELGDSRKFRAAEIDKRISQALNGDDQWVLIGGPPCQVYSVAGLARLRRELFDVLKRHEDRASAFHSEVTAALDAMKARREEAARSTTHGREFESLTVEFVGHEATRTGDIATATGYCTGTIKYCKVGDAVVELGPDSAAPGEKFVVEAKEDRSIDLNKARTEIELARKNRGAAVGVFVFSKKTAAVGQEPFFRLGNDIFVIWDAEDISDDVILSAALSLAKALCMRELKQRKAEDADFKLMDDAILAIETEAARLGSMKTWTETIKANSGKLLDEIRKLSEALDLQVENLRNALSGLRPSTE